MPQCTIRVDYHPLYNTDAVASFDLVEFEEIHPGGHRLVGETDDGREVVVWVESGDVRAKDDSGTYSKILGTVAELKGVRV